jgi:hypothetical protein
MKTTWEVEALIESEILDEVSVVISKNRFFK